MLSRNNPNKLWIIVLNMNLFVLKNVNFYYIKYIGFPLNIINIMINVYLLYILFEIDNGVINLLESAKIIFLICFTNIF